MKVLDPGHMYSLDPLDGACENTLVFVKREGEKYPGNVGHHAGTTTQEVLRALIDRTEYVNNQIPCEESAEVAELLKKALCLLEQWAAKRHGRTLTASIHEVLSGSSKCVKCGHVGCPGDCKGGVKFVYTVHEMHDEGLEPFGQYMSDKVLSVGDVILLLWLDGTEAYPAHVERVDNDQLLAYVKSLRKIAEGVQP